MTRREAILAGSALLATAGRATTSRKSADDRVDALLASMGGRVAWAAARGYRVEAEHWLIDQPLPSRNWILLDFASPRVRIESAPAGAWRARILDGSRGWRLAGTDAGAHVVEARALTAAEVVDDGGFWRANVYRTIHRLAKREAGVSAAIDNDDRLVVADTGGALLWFRQSIAGIPVAFGPAADPRGTIFGPLRRWGPLAFPDFSVRDGGRWRAIIMRFAVDPDLSLAAFMAGVPKGLR